MNLTDGIVLLFAVAASMVFFIGSLMMLKGLKEKYLA